MADTDEAAASLPPRALTVPQYIQCKGQHCPFCTSFDIEATEGVDVDGGTATQEIRCNDCERFWTDVYRLVGYLVTPE